MPIKSITTKKGDQGASRLFSGEVVAKNSPRLETYGDIDELGAVLGIARFHAKKQATKDAILYLQRTLIHVSAELATTPENLKRVKIRVDEKMLGILDQKRDALEATITIPNGFVVSGDSLATAYLEHARTIARRCERKVVGLIQDKIIDNPLVIVWFNRLSDYLYLLARSEEDKPTLA